MRIIDEFVQALVNLQGPEMFLGVARILKVELMEGDKPRDFYDIWGDVLEQFNTSPRKRKRELLKIVREASANGN